MMVEEPVNLLNIELPKWPALRVVGKSVTREQAMEILVRTDNWWIMTNDKVWATNVLDVAGIRHDGYHVNVEDRQRFCTEMHVLDLEFLQNAQIASAWIGGPMGWCDWNGNIFCNSFNIGKWPKVQNVLDEWTRIAEAFPFLSLTCQINSGESSEETVPLVEFTIHDGYVTMQSPGGLLVESGFDDINMFGSERGCDIKTLKTALDLVRSRA